jgi:hypothetical protein
LWSVRLSAVPSFARIANQRDVGRETKPRNRESSFLTPGKEQIRLRVSLLTVMRARRYHTRTVPKFLVHHEESGFVTRDGGEFIGYVLRMLRCRGTHASMRLQARRFALDASWDKVFETVW